MEKILFIIVIGFFAYFSISIGVSYVRIKITKRMMSILDSVQHEEHSDEFMRGVLYVSERMHDL